jgi:hypothetical protein
VENLAKTFSAEGFGTVSVHGDKSQADREASLRKFVANQCPAHDGHRRRRSRLGHQGCHACHKLRHGPRRRILRPQNRPNRSRRRDSAPQSRFGTRITTRRVRPPSSKSLETPVKTFPPGSPSTRKPRRANNGASPTPTCNVVSSSSRIHSSRVRPSK